MERWLPSCDSTPGPVKPGRSEARHVRAVIRATIRRVRIPEEVIEHPAGAGLEGEYQPEYMVEPEHIRETTEV